MPHWREYWIGAARRVDGGILHGVKSDAGGAISHGRQTKEIMFKGMLGRPAVIRLTPVNVSDIRIVDELVEAAGTVRRADRIPRYDANNHSVARW